MISDNDIKQVKEEYEKSLVELGQVEREKDVIIHEYVDELEAEKVKEIRKSLGLLGQSE